MTVIFYASLEAPSSTTNTTWTDHVSKSGILNARPHWLWVYAEYGGINTNRNVAIRVLINGMEIAFDYHQPSVSGEYRSFSTMAEVTPLSDGSLYTATLQYVAQASPQTALIRRARLMLMQQ